MPKATAFDASDRHGEARGWASPINLIPLILTFSHPRLSIFS